MPDNNIITRDVIDNLASSMGTTLQRMSLKQAFFASQDNQSVASYPLTGDLSSPGVVIWTIEIPFVLTSTTNSYNISFSNGPVFNVEPTLSFAIQMDNANFGIVPIITKLDTKGAAITLKAIAGQPSSNQSATGLLHVTAIGYH